MSSNQKPECDLVICNVPVSSLDEMRSKVDSLGSKAIVDLIQSYSTGSLGRFLIDRGFNELADQLLLIRPEKDKDILEALYKILGFSLPIPYSERDAPENSSERHRAPNNIEENLSNTNAKNSNQSQEAAASSRKKSTFNQEESKMSARYNVVIVGQTGVGKSELINYLYGHTKVTSGIGKPVTKNGFHPINLIINKLPVTIFDSWGIEVATYNQWIKELENELKGRGLDNSADRWFHSVYYCINAGSARVQDADISIIRKFQENLYNVNIILTKADSLSEEETVLFSNEIKKYVGNIKIIPVCSVTKLGRGYTINQFGREDIENQAYLDFYSSLVKRLPGRCGVIIIDAIKNWANEQRRYVEKELGWQGHNADDISSKINSSFKALTSNIPDLIGSEIRGTLAIYNQFSESMHYPASSFDIFDNVAFRKRSAISYFESYDSVWDFGDFIRNVGTTIINGPRAFFRFLTNSVGDDERRELLKGISNTEEALLLRVPGIQNNVASHLALLRDKAASKGA